MPSWWWFPLVQCVSPRTNQRLFPKYLMRRSALLMLCAVALVGVTPVRAAVVRTHWDFAWDPHPQGERIDHFVLKICVSAICQTTDIPGGTTTFVRRIFVSPLLNGAGIAVLRACDRQGACSGDSNTVTLDRTPPDAPTAVHHQPGFNH